MSSQIPYCGTCRQTRDAEIARIKATRDARKKEKGKGKAKGWGSGSESEDEIPEWSGGLPGIIKVNLSFRME